MKRKHRKEFGEHCPSAKCDMTQYRLNMAKISCSLAANMAYFCIVEPVIVFLYWLVV